MAMMISQIQLLSNRLQKQLFILVSPFKIYEVTTRLDAARPSVIILCGNTEKVREKRRTLSWQYCLYFTPVCPKPPAPRSVSSRVSATVKAAV